MAFIKREQSFCVLEYARTLLIVTVLAANQGKYVGELSLKNISETFSLYRHKNNHDLLRNLFDANF
jgi:hypothetical protein